MSTKHQVHNLIILDESGSMESIKQPVISGFNELVQTIQGVELRFPEQEHYISLISFNGAGRKSLMWKEPVAKLKLIDTTSYQPQENTPLFDAMGDSINKLKDDLYTAGPHNVLVTVFTDGEENASKEYSASQIKKMVEELQKHNWTFTYIGTDHDVNALAVSISITNIMKFERNESSIKDMFAKESSARFAYSTKIRTKSDTSGNFYEDEKN